MQCKVNSYDPYIFLTNHSSQLSYWTTSPPVLLIFETNQICIICQVWLPLRLLPISLCCLCQTAKLFIIHSLCRETDTHTYFYTGAHVQPMQHQGSTTANSLCSLSSCILRMHFTHKDVCELFLTCTEICNVSHQLKIASSCLCISSRRITLCGCAVAKSAVVIIAFEFFTLEGDTLQESMCFHTSWIMCLCGEFIFNECSTNSLIWRVTYLYKLFLWARSEIDWT